LQDGLQRDRAQRFQSVAQLEARLQDLLVGRCPVRCPVTLTKRTTFEFLGWLDGHPVTFMLLAVALILGVLGAVGFAIFG
jgi:hypothetical protein